MGAIAVKVAGDRELVLLHRDDGSDVAVIHQVWAARVYDPVRLQRWPDLERHLGLMATRGKRPLVIDAGANIGASSLFFGEFFATSHVVAVEPEPNNFKLLAHNAAQTTSLHCVHGAVASQRGHLDVFDPDKGAVGFRAMNRALTANGEGAWTGTTVEAYSVWDLIGMAPADCEPFMIKIDIEGGESDLFSKNTSWIDLFPLIVVELHDWMLPGTGNSRNFLCAIAATGRDFVQVGENTFSIRN